MAAIRRQRIDVAEYLIDQLAIDVNFAPDLHEFRMRTKAPIRERTYSCRDLAYEKGMMELVDFIDLLNTEVTPNIKRYLKKRLQARLDNIHDEYLQRTNEQNKTLTTSQTPEVTTARGASPITNTIDEKNSTSDTLPVIDRPYKSHIIEAAQNIDTTPDESIDVSGKKTFHFNNYSLRFRLVDQKDTKQDVKEQRQSPTKTSVPSLPILAFPLSPSPPLILSNTNRRSISETSTHFSNRDTCLSVCHSVRSTNMSQLGSFENKPLITSTPKHLLPKRFNQNNVKYRYIPEQDTSYNPPRRLMPVTLKATAIGLPSDSKIIRD